MLDSAVRAPDGRLLGFSWSAHPAVLVRDEHALVRELLEQCGGLTEVRGEHAGGTAGNPVREIDRLVLPGVEADKHATPCAPDILDRVPVALRDVGDVALPQRLRPHAAVRAEH